ncbi:MAG TPA: serine hydrolase, partial [Rudaea sp.]|nr:serine hydrolase [Rudaea sp.]
MKLLHTIVLAALFAFSTLAAPLTAAPHKHKKEPAADTQPAPQVTPASAELPTPNPAPRPAPGALNVPTPPPPALDAKSWVLMDYATGQILAQDNADERVEPASITKMMTGYIVSAELAAGKIKLDDPVMVSEHAWRAGGAGTDGSTTFLKVNSQVPLKDLLYGMIIQSGNDAAIALAEHVAGSEDTFANLMNEYAAKLGMTGTHFVNATGLPDPNHYSTAHDIAVLARHVIHDYPNEYK